MRYGRILMLSLPTFALQNMFQSFFVTAEKPHLGFYFTVGAGCTNMVLDVLMVGVWGWGVEGAAIAHGEYEMPVRVYLRAGYAHGRGAAAKPSAQSRGDDQCRQSFHFFCFPLVITELFINVKNRTDNSMIQH